MKTISLLLNSLFTSVVFFNLLITMTFEKSSSNVSSLFGWALNTHFLISLPKFKLLYLKKNH